MSTPQAYTVGNITRYIKQRLESDTLLQDVWVTGEISNLTQHGSGHVYFTLKDEEAQLACAMFKAVALQYLRNMPKHGAKVVLRGGLSLYPPRGSYQLIVKELHLAGEGDLHRKFIELRDKLKDEGLFEPGAKQPIPRYPRKIGIVTSPTGAVIRDILDTLRRRYPHVEVLVAPAVVQGEAGADSIIQSLALLQKVPDLDVIILARGGGSLEDLWCFNEERVARAIFACRVPLISGVGHETDTTIADFVADLRAATPTAAAEQAVPVASELRNGLDQAESRMGSSLMNFIQVRQQMLDDLGFQMEHSLQNHLLRLGQQLNSLEAQMQTGMLHNVQLKRQLVMDLERRIQEMAFGLVSGKRNALDMLELQFQQFDVRQILERGFTVTTKEGKPVKEAAEVVPGDRVTTHFWKGKSISIIDIIDDGKEGS
jgi:exodeoxyribonuclease VII large subunit